MLPAPSIVRPYAPLMVPPDETSTVRVSASVCISVAAASVIEPDNVLLPDTLRTAPTSAELTDTPSPDSVSASAMVMPPLIDSVASAATVVPPAEVPSDASFEIATTPSETVVDPV